MAYNNYKYVIIDDSEVSSLDFSKIIETSSDTLRYNNETPSFLEGKTQYTHEQILNYLNDESNGWVIASE